MATQGNQTDGSRHRQGDRKHPQGDKTTNQRERHVDQYQSSLLELSLQAQREFSGNVSHELRTPLAGIRALAEYGLAQQDPGVWRQQLEQIGSSERRASLLVEQLLAMALAEESDLSLHIEPVGLNQIVQQIVLRFMPRADALGVDLGVQGLEQPISVLANPALLEGAPGNLIDNALRYGRAAVGHVAP